MAYLPAAERPTKRLQLPSNSEHWIEYYATMNWADRKALRTVAIGQDDPNTDYFSVASDVALLRLIADWSLDNADGAKLPITQENIDLLADADADALLDALAQVVSPIEDTAKTVQKKSGGKTSTAQSRDTAKPAQ